MKLAHQDSASRPPVLPSPGDRIAGRYVVVREIGRGGMGAVYEARHEVTGRQVAIKWMLPMFAHNADAVTRFVREAKLAASVDHENVVDIYDVGNEDGGFFLVMEYLRGRSLAERLEAGAMLLPELVSVMRGVCAGLAAAHAAGVVHRDLKPENIFLAESRNQQSEIIPKIVDFGVSKALAPGESHQRLTGTGVAMGTPYYMSPEQIHSAADVGFAADIYSLGIMAYEALCGELPYQGDTAASIIVKVATEVPRPLTDLVPGLDPAAAAAVHRAMAKKADERFPSVSAFYEALASRASGAAEFAGTLELPEAALGTAPTVAVPMPAASASAHQPIATAGAAPAEPPIALPVRSNLWVFAAIALLGALAAGGLIAWKSTQEVAPVAAPRPAPVTAAETPPPASTTDTPATAAAGPEATADNAPAPEPSATAAMATTADVAAPPSAAAAPRDSEVAPAREPARAPRQATRPRGSHTEPAPPTTAAPMFVALTPPTSPMETPPPATPMVAQPPSATMVGRLQTVADLDAL